MTATTEKFAFILLAVVLVGVAYWSDGADGSLSSQSATVTPSNTPELDPAARPVFDAVDAIARAQLEIPTFIAVHSGIARLMTHHAYGVWRGSAGSWETADPVWIIGFQADDFVRNGAVAFAPIEMPESIFNETESGNNTPLEGVFVALDANSGNVVEIGALDTLTPRTYASLSAFVDQPLDIHHATAPPILPSAPPAGLKGPSDDR